MDDRPLTVVQLLPALDGGGVERGTVELSQELVRRGHRSLVISGGGRLEEVLRGHGATHHRWSIGKKSPFTLRWVWPLRQLLLEQQVDILHARSRVPAWVGWLALKTLPRSLRPHFITTAHGLYSVNRFSEIMCRGERVIAISRTVQDYLQSSYPRLAPERIRLVYRGVEGAEFPYGHRPEARWIEAWYTEYPQLRGCPVMTLAGRLTRCKGHLDFIELAERLRSHVPDIKALIVGAEDERRRAYAEQLRELIRQRGLSHVIFTGQRGDLKDIYAVSDVVLSLTSHPPEAFGRTTLEALSLGIPVVGYDAGGTGEILSQVFPEGAVPLGDVDALAGTVLRMIHETPPVPRTELFRRKTMIEQTLSVYREVA